MDFDVFKSCECGSRIKLEILMGIYGYFIGYNCKRCNTIYRISGMYPTKKPAKKDFLAYADLETGR